jgi:hypothetical protein
MWKPSKEVLFTEEHAEILRQAGRGTPSPGTIALDFEAHVTFFREQQVAPTGRNDQLPLSVLGPLNERLARPIRHGLQRPVLKSYPHVGGLFLLARASGMLQVGSQNAKPVFQVDEWLWSHWQSLNPTERYCSLLETWLLRATIAILGEHVGIGGGFLDNLYNSTDFLLRITSVALVVAGDKEIETDLRYYPGRFNLGLLELFGLIEIERLPPVEGKGWQIGRLAPTVLGMPLMSLVHDRMVGDRDQLYALVEEEWPAPGRLRPFLLPYFRAWRKTLPLPAERVVRAGAYVFKVTLWYFWCRITIPATDTLFDLAEAIVSAVDFDQDHLFEFRYRDRFGVPVQVADSFWERSGDAGEVSIGALPFRPGGRMTLIYDFGDWWEFEITLERIDPADQRRHAETTDPHGEPPTQYGRWVGPDELDEWEDEGDWD